MLAPVRALLEALGVQWGERTSRGELSVRYGGRENHFYLFGGRNEASAALIQGVTLAGVLLDEAALMPRSFVEQACARCSEAGSKLWFSLQPSRTRTLVLPGMGFGSGREEGAVHSLYHGR